MESEQKDALKITFLKVGKVDAIIAQTQEERIPVVPLYSGASNSACDTALRGEQ